MYDQPAGLERVLAVLLALLPAGLWCAWWLWCVNWKDVWPVLARGAWLVVVLLVLSSALAWSAIFPSTCNCIGVPLPNFWWQLGYVAMLVAVALFCGWLQGVFRWTPSEISLDPPAPSEHAAHH